MKQFAQVENFWFENQKWLKIVIPCVLAVLFIGSLLLAIFIGGEFSQSDNNDVTTVKGILKIDAEYETEYSVGDNFSFNADTCVIKLLAKDPAIENTVKIEKLPRSEFAFMVNGEGTVYSDPSEIVITEDVKYISVVSTYYTNLKTNIDITVLGGEEEAE